MIQYVQRIERAIKERRDIDVQLVNWWVYTLFLSWITCGIYPIYLFFKRTERVDGFIRRKKDYYLAVLDFTEKYAQEINEYDKVRNEINDLKDYTNAYIEKQKEIGALKSILLMIFTLGIYGFIYLYYMNKIWNEVQNFEIEFYDKLSEIWKNLNLLKYPIMYNRNPKKNRSYWLYLILSIITFNIFGLYWDYLIHIDPDHLYKEIHSAEDAILNAIRNNVKLK